MPTLTELKNRLQDVDYVYADITDADYDEFVKVWNKVTAIDGVTYLGTKEPVSELAHKLMT